MVTGALTFEGFNFTSKHFQGDLLVLCSAICWVVYSFLEREIVEKNGSLLTTAWSMLFGGLQMLVLAQFYQTNTFINWHVAWPWLVYLSFFSTAVAFLAWYKAMERVNWPLLNIIQCLNPVFTIIIARVVLGESLDWFKTIGAFLVVMGVVIAGRKQASKNERISV